MGPHRLLHFFKHPEASGRGLPACGANRRWKSARHLAIVQHQKLVVLAVEHKLQTLALDQIIRNTGQGGRIAQWDR